MKNNKSPKGYMHPLSPHPILISSEILTMHVICTQSSICKHSYCGGKTSNKKKNPTTPNFSSDSLLNILIKEHSAYM